MKDGPTIEPDGRLSPAEERELYPYYGPERDDAAQEPAPRTVTEPAHPVDAVRLEVTGDVVVERREGRDEDQVAGPMDPPEAQRNVAAPPAEKPLLRRYGN